eukprot:2141822-Pyramimonas_sp.AAC.1
MAKRGSGGPESPAEARGPLARATSKARRRRPTAPKLSTPPPRRSARPACPARTTRTRSSHP